MNLANTVSDIPRSKFHFSFPFNISFQKRQNVTRCNRLGSSLKFHTLKVPRRHLDALFLITVFSGSNFCPSLVETIAHRVATRNIRYFTFYFHHILIDG